jgi:hypothetical protein
MGKSGIAVRGSPLSTRALNANLRLKKLANQIVKSSDRLPLKTYLGEGFVDPFASSSVPMTNTMNLYFCQCKSSHYSCCDLDDRS